MGRRDALHWSAREGFAEMACLLVQSRADVSASDERLMNALHSASAHGKTDVVEILLHAGSPLDALDRQQRSPLHHAANSGHLDVCKLLLGSRALPNGSTQKSSHMHTPADLADHNGFEDVATLIRSSNLPTSLPHLMKTKTHLPKLRQNCTILDSAVDARSTSKLDPRLRNRGRSVHRSLQPVAKHMLECGRSLASRVM